jgi:hypothetical protein
MANLVPFIPSDNNYRVRVPFDGISYRITARWNSRDKAWYLDLYEDNLTPIALGIKVVLGVRLGRAYRHKKFFQDNVLQALDTTGKRQEAGFDDLGGRIQVVRMSTAEARGE